MHGHEVAWLRAGLGLVLHGLGDLGWCELGGVAAFGLPWQQQGNDGVATWRRACLDVRLIAVVNLGLIVLQVQIPGGE